MLSDKENESDGEVETRIKRPLGTKRAKQEEVERRMKMKIKPTGDDSMSKSAKGLNKRIRGRFVVIQGRRLTSDSALSLL